MSGELKGDRLYLFYYTNEPYEFTLFVLFGFVLDLIFLVPKLMVWFYMWLKLHIMDDQELQEYYDTHAMITIPHWYT